MDPLPRIASVAVAGPATLEIRWRDAPPSRVDLAGWIARNALLADLGRPEVFSRAAVCAHGTAVTWDDDAGDLAIDAEHLRLIAAAQASFGALDAAAWQAALGVSNAEAADLVGVSVSTWSAYKSGAPIPPSVARLCRAIASDPVLLHAHLKPRRTGRPRSDAGHSAAVDDGS